MAGSRRGTSKPLRAAARMARRREFWRARVESAATPNARVAAATDCLRVALTRAHPDDAERISRMAAGELLRHAEGLAGKGGTDDRSAA